MKFRPCIDIHNGKVKQIVGGSLLDTGNQAKENFTSDYDGAFYANLYKEKKLKGGHIILLNPVDSEFFEETQRQGFKALEAYQGGLQIGGGITSENAEVYLEKGASHVIVTSYVFQNGEINFENLEKIKRVVGKEHLVLDLSCRKKDEEYYIVTDRWQKFTEVKIESKLLEELSNYCDEYLIHGVDVEGLSSGIEKELVSILGNWGKIPITYAGGVGNFKDLEELREIGKNKLDVTIGSSLDLFGGKMEFDKVLSFLESSAEFEGRRG